MNPITRSTRQSAAAATLAVLMTLGLLASLDLLASRYHDEAALGQATLAQTPAGVASVQRASQS